MEHKIKMIGFDMDGTLLTSEKKLTEYTRKVLNKAIDLGIVVLPVTGRPLSGIPKEMREFEGIHYLIVSNGARVVEDGKTICENLLPVEKARKILDILEDYDTLRDVYYDGQGYTQEEELKHISKYLSSPAMANYVVSTRIAVADIRKKFEEENRDLDKIQGIFANPVDKIEAMERINALGGVEATGALANNIEVNGGGVHKGKTLLWLAKRLGIKREEVMAFGDGTNDMKMIRDVGVGVCMANGVQVVKDVADIIAPSNDEEGVAKTIEQYVFS